MATPAAQKQLLDRIKALQKDVPPNRRCAICGDVGATYICMTFGTFVCTPCSGVHREFNHKVRGISMSKWTAEDVAFIETHGNQNFKDMYFARWRVEDNWELPQPGNIEQLRSFMKSAITDMKWSHREKRHHRSSRTDKHHLPPGEGKLPASPNDPRKKAPVNHRRLRPRGGHIQSPRESKGDMAHAAKATSPFADDTSDSSPPHTTRSKPTGRRAHPPRRKTSPPSNTLSESAADDSSDESLHRRSRQQATRADRSSSRDSCAEGRYRTARRRAAEVVKSHRRHKDKRESNSMRTRNSHTKGRDPFDPFVDETAAQHHRSPYSNPQDIPVAPVRSTGSTSHVLSDGLFNMPTSSDPTAANNAAMSTSKPHWSVTATALDDAIAQQRYSGDPFATIDTKGITSVASPSLTPYRAGSAGSAHFQMPQVAGSRGCGQLPITPYTSGSAGQLDTLFQTTAPTTLPINPVSYNFPHHNSNPQYASMSHSAAAHSSSPPVGQSMFAQYPPYPSSEPQQAATSDLFADLAPSASASPAKPLHGAAAIGQHASKNFDLSRLSEEQRQQYIALRRQQDLLALQLQSLEKIMATSATTQPPHTDTASSSGTKAIAAQASTTQPTAVQSLWSIFDGMPGQSSQSGGVSVADASSKLHNANSIASADPQESFEYVSAPIPTASQVSSHATGTHHDALVSAVTPAGPFMPTEASVSFEASSQDWMGVEPPPRSSDRVKSGSTGVVREEGRLNLNSIDDVLF